jgi:hypothetical protein
MVSHEVLAIVRAFRSVGSRRWISVATGTGKTTSAPASFKKSRKSARTKKISGEAFTTGGSPTVEFPLQVVKVHNEGICLFAC